MEFRGYPVLSSNHSCRRPSTLQCTLLFVNDNVLSFMRKTDGSKSSLELHNECRFYWEELPACQGEFEYDQEKPWIKNIEEG